MLINISRETVCVRWNFHTFVRYNAEYLKKAFLDYCESIEMQVCVFYIVVYLCLQEATVSG